MQNILHIDDDCTFLILFADFMESYYKDVKLFSFDNWTKAKNVLRDGTNFDLILLDQNMPSLSGNKIYEEIFKEFPDIKNNVVFMTGSNNFCYTHRPHLRKPIDLEDLAVVIDVFVKNRVK